MLHESWFSDLVRGPTKSEEPRISLGALLTERWVMCLPFLAIVLSRQDRAFTCILAALPAQIPMPDAGSIPGPHLHYFPEIPTTA